MKKSCCVLLRLLACAAPFVSAQTVDPFYSGAYTLFNLGAVAGVPTNY